LGGKTSQKHSDFCWARMAEAMAGSKRVEDARGRKWKFVEEALKAEEQKQGEKKEKDKGIEDQGGDKRKILDEIEAEAMQTDDIEELRRLFTDHVEEEERATGKGWPAEGGAGAPTGKRTRDDDDAGGASAKTDVPMGSLELTQEEEFEADEWALGDVVGQWLGSGKVAAERKDEVQYMAKLSMLEPAKWEECLEKTGKPPIPTKWIDVDKGTSEELIIRSRLVARDFRLKGEAARLRPCRPWRRSGCCS
jgi:hypothetical protein